MGFPAGALIDLDGTLVDSAPELAAAINETLTTLGLPVAAEAAIRERIGAGVGTLVKQSLHAALGRVPSEDERSHAQGLFDRAYDARVGTAGPVCPGVFTGLERLLAVAVPRACVTNNARRFTVPMLERLGLSDWLDVIVTGDDSDALKPDPAPLRLAAERLGVAVEDCLMIGDSAIDVAAARAAGCPVWCVRGGFARGEPVEAAGPDAVFGRFDELVAALPSH